MRTDIRIIAESLHRLFIDKRVDKAKIKELLDARKITLSEYEYIISDENRSPLTEK